MFIDIEKARRIVPSVVIHMGNCNDAGSYYYVKLHKDYESLHNDYHVRGKIVRALRPAIGVAPTVEEAFSRALEKLKDLAPGWGIPEGFGNPSTDDEPARPTIREALQALVDCWGVGSKPEAVLVNLAPLFEEARDVLKHTPK